MPKRRYEAQAAKGDWPTACAFGCFSACLRVTDLSLQVPNEQSIHNVAERKS
jgi:hypothetical protein